MRDILEQPQSTGISAIVTSMRLAVVAAAVHRPLKAIDKRHGIEGVPPYRKRLL